MKNALQVAMERWEAERNGNIPIYKWVGMELHADSSGNINFLLESANLSLSRAEVAKGSYEPFHHIFGRSLASWMGRFVGKGFTTAMLRDLRSELHKIRFYHFLMPAIPTRGKPNPHWELRPDMEDFAEPTTAAAYAFSQQLTMNGFDGLRRCRMESCHRFFIGRPDAKWCSKKCGSKYRVTQKRKRDRA